MKNLEKNEKKTDRLHIISAAILARRRQPVASVKALAPLRRLMRLVLYWRTDRASETADKYGTFSSFFMAYNPAVRPGRYGANTRPMTPHKRDSLRETPRERDSSRERLLARETPRERESLRGVSSCEESLARSLLSNLNVCILDTKWGG